MSDTQVAADSKVKITRDGDVAILTMSDPATMNAAGVDMAGRPDGRGEERCRGRQRRPAPSC